MIYTKLFTVIVFAEGSGIVGTMKGTLSAPQSGYTYFFCKINKFMYYLCKRENNLKTKTLYSRNEEVFGYDRHRVVNIKIKYNQDSDGYSSKILYLLKPIFL